MKTADVVIIGGGIIGCSSALHLAKAGLKVILVDYVKYGIQASQAAAGLLTPYQHSENENPKITDFLIKSKDYMAEFITQIQNETKINLGYKEAGSLYIVLSKSEIVDKEYEMAKLNKTGANIGFLNKRETLNLCPNLNNELVGSYFYPKEGKINNLKLVKVLKSLLLKYNVEIINSEVVEICQGNQLIDSCSLSSGEKLFANNFVLSNGYQAAKFLNTCFVDYKDLIFAMKGEVLELKIDDVNDFPDQNIFTHEGYILSRIHTHGLEKTKILVGSTQEKFVCEDVPLNLNNTPDGVLKLCNLFKSVFPSVSAQVTNMWAGFRPCTNDSLPIISKISECDNLFLGLGHYRNGILMGPITGKIISDLILKGSTEQQIEMFNVNRFLKVLH